MRIGSRSRCACRDQAIAPVARTIVRWNARPGDIAKAAEAIDQQHRTNVAKGRIPGARIAICDGVPIGWIGLELPEPWHRAGVASPNTKWTALNRLSRRRRHRHASVTSTHGASPVFALSRHRAGRCANNRDWQVRAALSRSSPAGHEHTFCLRIRQQPTLVNWEEGERCQTKR